MNKVRLREAKRVERPPRGEARQIAKAGALARAKSQPTLAATSRKGRTARRSPNKAAFFSQNERNRTQNHKRQQPPASPSQTPIQEGRPADKKVVYMPQAKEHPEYRGNIGVEGRPVPRRARNRRLAASTDVFTFRLWQSGQLRNPAWRTWRRMRPTSRQRPGHGANRRNESPFRGFPRFCASL